MKMENVKDCIFSAIDEFAGLLNMPVKYPDKNGPTDADQWFDVVHIPNGTSYALLSKSENMQGIVRIGYTVLPNNGSNPDAMCDEICQTFSKDLRLFGTEVVVEFYRDPVINGPLENGQNTVYPVTLYYRSYAN